VFGDSLPLSGQMKRSIFCRLFFSCVTAASFQRLSVVVSLSSVYLLLHHAFFPGYPLGLLGGKYQIIIFYMIKYNTLCIHVI
jgi:hypothetical protein